MTKYGSDDVYISIDGNNISADVLEISPIDREALVEEAHGFGDTWIKSLATGLKRLADLTFKGWYDDTSTTGTDALLNREGGSAQVYIRYGGAKSTTVPVIIKNYRRLLTRGELHKFEAVVTLANDPSENA